MSFYKKDPGGSYLFSDSTVEGPGYLLMADKHTEHTYPVDGWYWFETEAEAIAAGVCEEDEL